MLEARGISKAFGGTTVLKEASLALKPGEVTALMGPSGSGKTTLMRCLAMLTQPDVGTIAMDGKQVEFLASSREAQPLTPPWPRVTVVFQDLYLWPHMTNFDNVFRPSSRLHGRDAAAIVSDLAERLNIGNLLQRYPNEISRGQRQIVAFARAAALKPTYLLLDEISASLDVVRAASIAGVVSDLAGAGTGVLSITHQLGFAKTIGDCFAYLHDGRIVESGRVSLLDNPQSAELSSYLSLVSRIF